MYFFYSLATALGAILLIPYVLLSGARRKKYLPNLAERLALKFPLELRAKDDARPRTIWFHAVSVGEVLAGVPIARCLKQRFPAWRLVVSTTTVTGQTVARQRIHFADAILYFPFDWNGPLRRAFQVVRPKVIIILETEIWPNLLRCARKANVPVVFINGRISDGSFRGFSRAIQMSGGVLRGFLGRVLRDAKLYLVQTSQDASRLIALGAPVDRITVTGSMKYDIAIPAPNAFVEWLQAELTTSEIAPLIVAGSMIADEEARIMEAFAALRQKWPKALLILAPRKPERFGAAAEIIGEAGWQPIRRSEISLDRSLAEVFKSSPHERGHVLLLDTIGELASVYGLADVVFIGGSLESGGGHNPLEPAVFGKVPVFGPHMENFREITAALLESGAAIQVESAAQLGAAWDGLLGNAARRAEMGSAARQIVERNRGATAATLERVAAVIEEQQA